MVCFKINGILLCDIRYFLIELFFSVKFEDPNYGDNYIFEATRLKGVM